MQVQQQLAQLQAMGSSESLQQELALADANTTAIALDCSQLQKQVHFCRRPYFELHGYL